jgi:glycosyltransferase involved in cell wall biosynthesis
MKPKILVFTSTFPRWQNDTDPPFVYELSKRLTADFDVIVHTPHYCGALPRETMDGMQIHRFRYFIPQFEKLAGSTGILPTLRHNKLYYGLVPFFLLAQFFSLFLLVWKIRPDIIHAHWIIPQGFVAALVSMVFRVPVVATAHGADIFGLQGILLKKIKQFTLKRVRGITVVSQALAEVLNDLVPFVVQPQIVPMGIDSVSFHPDRRDNTIRDKYGIDGPFLLYVGRLTEKKGVDFLISAMPSVLKDFSTAKLLIVGGGELENDLKKQVENLELNKQIQFVGNIPNSELSAYYATADIFIGPSITAKSGDVEGFGLTFVEAAMSGCLLIGSDIGGIRDIIKDKVTGFLVPEKSSTDIANCIRYCLAHEIDIISIKKKARQRCIENFDWKVIVLKYSNFLNQALE